MGALFSIDRIQHKTVSGANGLILAEMVPDQQGLNRNIQALGNPGKRIPFFHHIHVIGSCRFQQWNLTGQPFLKTRGHSPGYGKRQHAFGKIIAPDFRIQVPDDLKACPYGQT